MLPSIIADEEGIPEYIEPIEKADPGVQNTDGHSPEQSISIETLIANVDYISMMTGVEIPTEEE